MAQDDMVQVAVSEIRKANETKAKLNVANAAVLLLTIDLKTYKDSTAHWKSIAIRETRRKKGWRKVAIVSILVNVAENSFLFLRRKQ
ncbi:hypothetical protein [Emticicia sp. BO119]|uniref:hypothetical protein n=1 Tax=Emticicia sp. BO119 TaxID=2757768 RepID=UPI0015EFE30B|nr:hypothetical protein [Emticicia sp. BO119]MBA4849497.1 hypothetical protein [Emticicia sp. BO119]